MVKVDNLTAVEVFQLMRKNITLKDIQIYKELSEGLLMKLQERKLINILLITVILKKGTQVLGIRETIHNFVLTVIMAPNGMKKLVTVGVQPGLEEQLMKTVKELILGKSSDCGEQLL